MAGGLFQRLKTWAGIEIVTNADLNAEFNNIINNLKASKISGYSETAIQMRIQTSPGVFGTESLSRSDSDEIERIRYQLNQVIGGPNNLWYDTPALSLSQINTILAPNGIPSNRIVSGRTSANSLQPMFLVPGGTSNGVTLKCSVTPFVCYINGVKCTFNSDITLTGLTVAPGGADSFTFADANMTGNADSKTYGDYISAFDSAVTPNQMLNDWPITGTALSAAVAGLVGNYAAFRYTTGGNTEYFLGFVADGVALGAGTLRKCFRGFFFDKNDAGIPPQALTNSDSVHLLRLTWVYLTNAGALAVSYTNPRYSATAPLTPASGDMWFDTANQQWKQWTGATWVVTNSILIGICVQDGTNTVGARSFDTFRTWQNTNTVVPEFIDYNYLRTKYWNNSINVYGTLLNFDKDFFRWSNLTDYEAGTPAAISTAYFLYITEGGKPKISTRAAYRRYDIGGWYHPYESWRCVGIIASTDGGGSSFPGAFDSARILTTGSVNGDFVGDRSLGASKKKMMPATPVAPVDGFAQSLATGNDNYSNTSYTDMLDSGAVNAAAAAVYTTGRPVRCGLMAGPQSGGDAFVRLDSAASAVPFGNLAILRNNVIIASTQLQIRGDVAVTSADVMIPPSAYEFFDLNPPAGINTYKCQLKVGNADYVIQVKNIQVFAYEL